MSPEQIELIDTLTWVAFVASWIILTISSINLRNTKKQLKSVGLLEINVLDLIREMEKDLSKIWAYNDLKHCGMDIDECTVTIVFDNKQETIDFLDTHESKSRVRMVVDNEVVKEPFCESCES